MSVPARSSGEPGHPYVLIAAAHPERTAKLPR